MKRRAYCKLTVYVVENDFLAFRHTQTSSGTVGVTPIKAMIATTSRRARHAITGSMPERLRGKKKNKPSRKR